MKSLPILMFFLLCFWGGIFNLQAGSTPLVVTSQNYARGSVAAFCEGQIQTVESVSVVEKGICWSTDRYPVITNEKSVYTGTNSKYLCKLEGLTPSTRYYVRAYAIADDETVGYGNEVEIVTIPRGNVTYTLNWNVEQNPDNKAHYDRIAAAMADAVAYYNDWTSITKHMTANYNSGVPTAEASYSGWISFGSNSSYQQTGTALHEMAHTIGVGQHSMWGTSPLMISGAWQGERANNVLQFITQDLTAAVKGDGTHFWPYGINGAHEDDRQDMTYIINCLIVQAMGEDGLPPSSGFASPSKVFESSDEKKYYIKNEAYQRGRNDSFLRVLDDETLSIKEMTAAQAIANDSAAWLIAFDPITQYYSIRNAATGKFFRYRAAGVNGIVVDEENPANAHYFQLMKGRVVDAVGSSDTYFGFRGYWIFYPNGTSAPTCLTASSNAITAGNYDFSNYYTPARWVIMTAEEAKQAEKALAAHGQINIDPNATYSIRPEGTSTVVVRSTDRNEKVDIGMYIISGAHYSALQWKITQVEGKDDYYTLTNNLSQKNLSISKWDSSDSMTDEEAGRANTTVAVPDADDLNQQIRLRFIESLSNTGGDGIVQIISIENDHVDGENDSRVFSLDNLGNVAYGAIIGNSIRTTTSGSTGQRWFLVRETTTDSGITNPSSEGVFVEISGEKGSVRIGELPEEGSIAIYDVTGRLYTQARHQYGSFSYLLPKGIYIVCIRMGTHFIQQKVMVS